MARCRVVWAGCCLGVRDDVVPYGVDRLLYGCACVVQRFVRDVAGALQYLHSCGVLFCDLSPHNIITDENGTAKVGVASSVNVPTPAARASVACDAPCPRGRLDAVAPFPVCTLSGSS
jgi:serine/threonine protein kinase